MSLMDLPCYLSCVFENLHTLPWEREVATVGSPGTARSNAFKHSHCLMGFVKLRTLGMLIRFFRDIDPMSVWGPQVQARVEPEFTRLVWQKLEEQNAEFFKNYYIKLKLRDQIMLFNHLIGQQMDAIRARAAQLDIYNPQRHRNMGETARNGLYAWVAVVSN